jgi:hypothetical protein
VLERRRLVGSLVRVDGTAPADEVFARVRENLRSEEALGLPT